jgi:hypothetical protein
MAGIDTTGQHGPKGREAHRRREAPGVRGVRGARGQGASDVARGREIL